MSDVLMPQLGETVTEGTITKWFKKVGDTVERDELLFEVSTDKVDSEVTSPATGVLVEIKVGEGDTVDVGSVLAVIGDVGASASAAPALAAPPVVEPEAVAAAPPPPPPSVAVPAAVAAPPPQPAAYDAGDDTASVDGVFRVLSPVVRKLINEHGIDPDRIAGTGAGGRITREDVLAVIENPAGSPVAPAVAAPTPAAAADAAVASPPVVAAPLVAAPVVEAALVAPAAVVSPPAVVASAVVVVAPVSAAPAIRPGGRNDVVPFSKIRLKTGEHMLMSLQTSPHAFIAVEVDFSKVDRVRGKVKDGFKADEGFSLTYLPFIARAVVEALRTYPNVNASVSNDSLIVHHSVHLGVAVDLDFQGLMVPVIRDADGKRMRAISRDIADIANRARTKKLTPDDLVGGTFTISNAGPYGIDLMSSIINQPQVAILSTTAVKKKPVVVELPDGSESIAVHPMGFLGLSWDHRAFDGAYAASFLAEVREILESRDWSTEL